ncbi:hypothetical protein P5G51_002865 [Virgibacillus sp. 179-BFC.A HS]|uniref:Uncharacterized protein n=1 Tax=Tigheibacillus jepli TaxID=3035914 RepID=A0ABU5CF73_9BACI|nr:hypothetical protein [Virgibacillus sp. 179-BFC.A HS]MDY0404489.1 hypothetical protein [Virgibacillus sp. 179-BFC.A HS]
MVTFKIKDVLLLNEKKSVTVLNNEDHVIAEVKKLSFSGNEKGKTFVLEQNGEQTILGIKKGRLIFATYRFQINGEEFILKDNPVNSIFYFCIDGMIHGKKLRIEEKWKKEIGLKIDGNEVALIKPESLGFGATILMNEETSRHSDLFSLTCLMYFMYKIYKDETEIIENMIGEWL